MFFVYIANAVNFVKRRRLINSLIVKYFSERAPLLFLRTENFTSKTKVLFLNVWVMLVTMTNGILLTSPGIWVF